VDTEALAAYLNTTPRTISRWVQADRIQPVGRWPDLNPGRPTMWFDLDTLPDVLLDTPGKIVYKTE
jgi:hypothetical protein